MESGGGGASPVPPVPPPRFLQESGFDAPLVGRLLGLPFGPQCAARYAAEGPGSCSSPTSSPLPRARPKHYTAHARVETASLWGEPPPGSPGWSRPGGPRFFRPGRGCWVSSRRPRRPPVPRRRRSPHASAGTPRPGVNTATQSAGWSQL
ncbi:hypothetical protein NDU88_006061 [Pleurodeles waltl]|uniref:Uncharacterized protein n=1 Tax=Pleurodeles waltl TaxID=8319 RepID=A0AAV7TX73_PLEWA|nr:hypothetical protein NDU88_006061 [Pleurodeles waltl]